MSAPVANWRAVQAISEPTLVYVDGRRFEIPPIATQVLLEHLAAGELAQIVPGSLPADQMREWAEHLLSPASSFDLADAAAIAEAVTAHITGLPARAAIALAGWLRTDWLLVDGYFLGRGVDLLTLPPRRLMAALYAFLVEHRFETRAEADQALFTQTGAPPAGATTGQVEQDGQAFLSAIAAAESPGT